MSFFDDSVDVAKDIFDSAAKKTSETVEISKIKYSISKQKRSLEKDFCTLGRLYYESVVGETEIAEMAKDLVEVIEDKSEGLEELEQKLAVARNSKLCPKCGKKNPKKSAFCNACGAKIG